MGERRNGKNGYWPWLAVMLLTGALLAFFHNMHVSGAFRPYRADILTLLENQMLRDPYKKEKLKVDGREIRAAWFGPVSIPFHVSGPKTMRVRMKAYFPETKQKSALAISVNGREVYSYGPLWDGKIELIEFDLPRHYLSRGVNSFDIKTDGESRAAYEFISLRDYAGISKNFPRAYVAFDSDVEKKPFAAPFDYVLFPASMFIAWVLCGNIMRASRDEPLALSLKKTVLWHVPFAALFIGAALFSVFTPYSLLLHPEPFYVFAFAPSAAIILLYGLPLAVRELPVLLENTSSNLSGMVSRDGKAESALSVLRLLFRNLGTLAVGGFIIFLTMAGVFMIVKRQDVAERMADIAYFLLVFGVFMRIFELKKEDKEGEAVSEARGKDTKK